MNIKENPRIWTFSNKKIFLLLFILLGSLEIIIILNSIDGNIINGLIEKNIANAQLLDSSIANPNIIDLKVSERNNNFLWTSANGQVNPELDLKAGVHYMIQLESMYNNIPHQLIIQDESGKQLAKSIEISNGQTDDFPFSFSNIGKYQYYCQFHPKTMHGNIVVS